MNGDSLPDLIEGGASQRVWLNSGTTWIYSNQWTTSRNFYLNLNGSSSSYILYSAPYGILSDLNGDGLVDFLAAQGGGSRRKERERESAKKEKEKTREEVGRENVREGERVRGERERTNFLSSVLLGNGAYINTGSGWSLSTSLSPPSDMFVWASDSDGAVTYEILYDVEDVNGDDLPDIVSDSGSYMNNQVYYFCI